ncbi:hypothetical protein EV359DRAFT_68888 [Lentinula novae-zelandiae]|nr:hypothetical protein EV359DRAFT_68888 [Lentinula novae-zelandiae]
MGIKDLWPLLDDCAISCQLREFVVQHGFINKHHGSWTVVIGVDVRQLILGWCGLSKTGRQVITNELDYLKQSKTLVQHFGYHCHMAPGDAEAEIVDMLKQGIIDTVLSKDSDVFPLGVESVMNLVVLQDKSRYWQELSIRIYSVRAIGFSQAGFLLIALLLHNDLGSGINGIGVQTVFRLAQSGFGNTLLEAYKSFSDITTAYSGLSRLEQRHGTRNRV